MRMMPIASGSSGNCIYLGTEDTHVLFDAGISRKRIEEGLNTAGLCLKDIDAIFVTHEHIDHTKGLGVISRKDGIPIYSTSGTIEGIEQISSLGNIPDGIFNKINADEDISIGDVTVHPFRIIDRAIAYMELGDFEEQFIDELSGGQRQRAYIAMVIAQDTEYILLDEPTNNLDIYHATNLMRIVRRLCDELGKTVILVLHEINYAAFYSDYICAFVDGKIAKFGTVQEVITKENLSDIYKVDFEIMQIEGKPLSIYY